MQITPRIHALRLPFQVRMPSGIALERFVYVYLIYGKRITLIDTGVRGSKDPIFAYIRSTGRDPSEIEQIILTHSHPDHIGAAREIQERTGCTVAAHPAERDWIEDVNFQERERPVPGFKTLVGGSVPVDTLLPDSSRIHPEHAGTLRVIHTPGHSAGSISLLHKEEGALFSGDAIPLPGDIPIYDDPGALVRSIHILRDIPDLCWLLSAWDEPQKGSRAYERMDAGIGYIGKIDTAVKKAAGAGPAPSPHELAARILASLGIPAAAANPLVARSFIIHLTADNPGGSGSQG
ncbi:MAG: MBL fold metallo-hydrolase [Methanoregulaceae archaeon]